MAETGEVVWLPIRCPRGLGQGYEMQNPQTEMERVRLQVRREGDKSANVVSDTTPTHPCSASKLP